MCIRYFFFYMWYFFIFLSGSKYYYAWKFEGLGLSIGFDIRSFGIFGFWFRIFEIQSFIRDICETCIAIFFCIRGSFVMYELDEDKVVLWFWDVGSGGFGFIFRLVEVVVLDSEIFVLCLFMRQSSVFIQEFLLFEKSQRKG